MNSANSARFMLLLAALFHFRGDTERAQRSLSYVVKYIKNTHNSHIVQAGRMVNGSNEAMVNADYWPIDIIYG